MRFDTPLDDVFRNRSHVRILRALHRMPAGLPASGRELARRAAVTHPTALKALDVFVDVGVVTAVRGLAGDVYDLNHDHVLADRVAGLFREEAQIGLELASFLQGRLLEQTDKVTSATIFGSAVWGESTLNSDIDIVVSCAARDVDEVVTALASVTDAVKQRFGNQLSALIDSGQKKRKAGIWKRIEGEGVPLIRCGKPVSR